MLETAGISRLLAPFPAVPYQPTRYAVTMKVAAENPNRPRIDGAAIGCRNTRVCVRHSAISAAAPLVDLPTVASACCEVMEHLLMFVSGFGSRTIERTFRIDRLVASAHAATRGRGAASADCHGDDAGGCAAAARRKRADDRDGRSWRAAHHVSGAHNA